MSDDWIVLIPVDPYFVPEAAARERATKCLKDIAPESDKITFASHDAIQFYDCGGNFSRVVCPACGAELSTGWWGDRMTEDYSAGFRLAECSTPCCQSRYSLDDLEYDWPQGFARTSLEAMNASIGALSDDQRKQLGDALGAPVRVIYRHI